MKKRSRKRSNQDITMPKVLTMPLTQLKKRNKAILKKAEIVAQGLERNDTLVEEIRSSVVGTHKLYPIINGVDRTVDLGNGTQYTFEAIQDLAEKINVALTNRS